jgi:exodeoxyribonuclease V alpha subunit
MIYDTIYRVGDKVLQLVNMPDDNTYNGDIGIILEIDNIRKEITIDYDSNIVTLTISLAVNISSN